MWKYSIGRYEVGEWVSFTWDNTTVHGMIISSSCRKYRNTHVMHYILQSRQVYHISTDLSHNVLIVYEEGNHTKVIYRSPLINDYTSYSWY